jgi:hypothetical protein
MVGWFDGLFQGAAEAANRFGRHDKKPPGGTRRGKEAATSYAAGFRQGLLDARAVAALRRSEGLRRWPRPADLASDPGENDPRT